MEHKLKHYRCSKCKSLITCCSERSLSEKRICEACGSVADVWNNGDLFWKLANEGKIEEAEKILRN